MEKVEGLEVRLLEVQYMMFENAFVSINHDSINACSVNLENINLKKSDQEDLVQYVINKTELKNMLVIRTLELKKIYGINCTILFSVFCNHFLKF